MDATGLDNELSDHVQTEGFDLQAGKSWIYPTNYPMREYQYRIVQESLYQNTLVSLPTGLGKTFIAAVVMFNFYRWYPSGKVIFMAPTRPLVKQQIDACYDIMAIPQNVTAELTGSKVQSSREEIWKSKRVFFVTPQVLQNDLDTVPGLGECIKCLVFDEAHKAKGNHAYCEVIRKMVGHSKYFRVLALSATPGSSVNDVIDLAKSLLIAHLEVRTEDSPDVAPYVFHRTLETVVVPLGGKLEEIKTKYLQILERYVRVLKDNGVIMGNCASLTKGRIFLTLKDFTNRYQHNKLPNHGEIVKTLNICITLYHGYELLIRHGLRGFLNFFEEHSDKALLRHNTQIFNVMAEVQTYIGPRPEINMLPDGTIPQIPHNSKFGHPKFYKLQQIVVDYFNNPENATSKVIIFSEFKETVLEAYAMLMQHPPLIKPKYFMGQGAITQKQQINIIKSFKEGGCNTLISTCIGEEGLDIGEVDLIICFDISNKSPIRLVQRMGRTGRKKQGKVIILVTEGKEQELLRDCIANKQYLSDHILKSKEITKNMYANNPRMIPTDIFPSCQKMHISVPKPIVKKKSGNLKDLFNKLAKTEPTISQVLHDVEIIENEDRIPERITYWDKCDAFQDDSNSARINYSKRLEVLRNEQVTEKIGHSKDTEILTSLLQFADAKRYNLPVTQLPALTQARNKRTKFGRTASTDNLKQTDIRNLLFKPKNPTEVIHEVDTPVIVIEENVKKKKHDRILNDLQSEISTYMAIAFAETTNCYFCEKTSLCNRLKKPNVIDLKISQWVQPDLGVIDNLTVNDFDCFLNELTKKENSRLLDDNDLDALNNMMDIPDDSFDFNETPKKEETFLFKPPDTVKKVFERCNISVSADEFEQSVLEGNVSPGKSIGKNLKKIDYSDIFDDSVFGLSGNNIFENKLVSPVRSEENESKNLVTDKDVPKKLEYSEVFDESIFGLSEKDVFETENKNNSIRPIISSNSIDRNLSMNDNGKSQIIDISDSPVISSGISDRETITRKVDLNIRCKGDDVSLNSKENTTEKGDPGNFDENHYRQTLDFFKLSKLSDLFEADDLRTNSNLVSPDLFDDSPEFSKTNTGEAENSSPVLNTYNMKHRVAKKLFTQDESPDQTFVDDFEIVKQQETPKLKKLCLSKLNAVKNSNFYTSSKEKINITKDLQVKEIIDEEKTLNKDELKCTYNELFSNIQDICDLSIFGISGNFPNKDTKEETNKITVTHQNKETKTRERSTCEESDSTCVNIDLDVSDEDLFDSPTKSPNKKLDEAIDINDFCDLSSFGFSQEYYSKTQDERKRNEKVCTITSNFQERPETSQLGSNKKCVNVTDKLRSNSVLLTDICDLSIFDTTEYSQKNISSSPLRINGKPGIQSPIISTSNKNNLSPLKTQKFDKKQSPIISTNNNSLSPVLSQKFKRKPSRLKKNNYDDLSIFETSFSSSNPKKTETVNTTSQKENQRNLELEDVCDLSFFGLGEENFGNTSIKEIVTPLKSSATVTQIMNLMNKTDVQRTQRNRNGLNRSTLTKNGDDTFSYLLDDDVFEDDMPMPTKETPIKAKTPKRTTTQKPSTSKIYNSNSDDEFEESPFKQQGWIRARKRLHLTNDSEREFKKPKVVAENRKRKNRNRGALNPFIEDEAVLSSDEYATDDTESDGGSSQDVLEMSFVDDNTLDIGNDTAMHAKYLESVRSPVKKGLFKIPERPTRNIIDVFSQIDTNNDDNTYLDDSFCVDVDDCELSQNHDLSELEIAEMRLEEQRKRKRKEKEVVNYKKRRRIKIISSSDSE